MPYSFPKLTQTGTLLFYTKLTKTGTLLFYTKLTQKSTLLFSQTAPTKNDGKTHRFCKRASYSFTPKEYPTFLPQTGPNQYPTLLHQTDPNEYPTLLHQTDPNEYPTLLPQTDPNFQHHHQHHRAKEISTCMYCFSICPSSLSLIAFSCVSILKMQ